MQRDLVIRGARAHNLKDLNLTIPRDKMVVVTGLSGSGHAGFLFGVLFGAVQKAQRWGSHAVSPAGKSDC